MNAVGKLHELSQSTGVVLEFSEQQCPTGFVCKCTYGTFIAEGEAAPSKKVAKQNAATKMLGMLEGKSKMVVTLPQALDQRTGTTVPLPPGIKFYPAVRRDSTDITEYATFHFISADETKCWPGEYKKDIMYVFVGTKTDIREYILNAFTPPIDQNIMHPNIRQHVVPDILNATKIIYLNAGALMAGGKKCFVYDT